MTASIIACFDDGARADCAIADYAGWASQRLALPLCLLHVLEHPNSTAGEDLSGQIGLGAREQLLESLTEEDARQAREARRQGRDMLAAVQERLATSLSGVTTLQRHGEVEQTLAELCGEDTLLVVGRCGKRHETGENGTALGEHLESLAQAVRVPLLVTPEHFRTPERAMIAFDGSARALRQVEQLIEQGWLSGLSCHVVQAGHPAGESSLDTAVARLQAAGLTAQAVRLDGEAKTELPKYARAQDLDFTVMGAYGHSSLRRWLSGSTTHHLLEAMPGALLLIRSRG